MLVDLYFLSEQDPMTALSAIRNLNGREVRSCLISPTCLDLVCDDRMSSRIAFVDFVVHVCLILMSLSRNKRLL